ncbi:MAG: 50S ribosomal protein L4 [Deltaproteobacteria bacterium]|nr:50S ribosomal protein L4 [Deltaproteobacteria bacterium]
MAKFDVVNTELKKVSEIELSDAVFAAEPNEHLIYEVAKFQAINRRAGTVAVKNTSLVSGGGKKPWKQKHTGRARQGSIRASHWVGGGKAMGPKPRDYTYRPPREVRRGALRVALSLRAREQKLLIVDKIEIRALEDKGRKRLSNSATKVLTAGLKLQNALVVDAKDNVNLHRGVRNLSRFDVLAPEGLNLESLLKHDTVVLTADAAKKLEGALAP